MSTYLEKEVRHVHKASQVRIKTFFPQSTVWNQPRDEDPNGFSNGVFWADLSRASFPLVLFSKG